ncbi:hypothetical protein BHE74_00042285, partial [Ensete ventricosum]
EVYAVSIVGPLPIAVTNLLDLTKVYELFSKYQLQFMIDRGRSSSNWLLKHLRILYVPSFLTKAAIWYYVFPTAYAAMFTLTLFFCKLNFSA